MGLKKTYALYSCMAGRVVGEFATLMEVGLE